jgi:acetyl-CoA acetyltransferase family protein
MYSKTYIPYKGYFSSPFARWQGTLQNEHPIELGAATAKRWLAKRGFDATMFDYLFLGLSMACPRMFYAAPWAAYMIGAEQIAACHIPQACSTGTTCMNQAAVGIETGIYSNVLYLGVDRMSNGPHTIWPKTDNMGGQVVSENWMLDNINYDPVGGVPMIQTAERVAQSIGGVTKEQVDAVALRRYEQYMDGMANDRAFQKEYLFPAEYKKARKEVGLLEQDEGVTPRTKESLAKARAAIEGGVHSTGAQTHPADGNCGVILTTREKAKELSANPKIEIQLLSYGFARAGKGLMPAAPVPAARMALEKAGLSIKEMKAIKTHNPFVVNDIYMASEMGIDVMSMNNYGCSMIFGHPQGPTVGRIVMELIEELVMKGGGYGLFTGCAAGDTGASLVIKVTG